MGMGWERRHVAPRAAVAGVRAPRGGGPTGHSSRHLTCPVAFGGGGGGVAGPRANHPDGAAHPRVAHRRPRPFTQEYAVHTARWGHVSTAHDRGREAAERPIRHALASCACRRGSRGIRWWGEAAGPATPSHSRAPAPGRAGAEKVKGPPNGRSAARRDVAVVEGVCGPLRPLSPLAPPPPSPRPAGLARPARNMYYVCMYVCAGPARGNRPRGACPLASPSTVGPAARRPRPTAARRGRGGGDLKRS